MNFATLNNHLQHNHHQQQQHHQQQHDHNPSSYQVWNNFFLKAGIPGNVANEYAITFSQHRIRIDMLKEITKEILLDMGIKAMGDIIAILRHAKSICTQDELKTGATSSTSVKPNSTSSNTSDHNAVVNPRQTVVNHLAARKTPISSTKSNPYNTGSTSLVGSNKVQSQVSLNSGALIASSNNLASQHEFLDPKVSNKRLALSTNNPISKRLRPASKTGQLQNNTVLPEKTLTVHYPPKSAIERAQQRLGLTTKNSIQTSFLSSGKSTQQSIKSRLGRSPQDTSSNYRVSLESNSSSRSSRDNNNHIKTWASVAKKNVHNRPGQSSSRSPNRAGQSWKGKHIRKEEPNQRQDSRRLKSAVFSRLGESAR